MSLLQEDAKEYKESTLFGGGFLERAAKRLEEEKALVKVTGAKPGGNPPPKRQRDPNDLRRFLERGAPARYGSRTPSTTSRTTDNSPCRRLQKGRARRHGSRADWPIRHCTHTQLMFFQQYYCPYAIPFSPPTYRTAPALHQELASLNNQPMGAAGCQGLQTGADVTSNPKVPASNGGDRGQANSGGRRGTEAAQQRGNKGRQPMPQPVCQQDFCGPEERWFLQTSCQLEATKSVHGGHTLQDGELGHAERPVTTRRLDGHY